MSTSTSTTPLDPVSQSLLENWSQSSPGLSRLEGYNWYRNGKELPPWFQPSPTLYHLTIFNLQHQLDHEYQSLNETAKIPIIQLERIRILLERHATAVRNWNYMEGLKSPYPSYPSKGAGSGFPRLYRDIYLGSVRQSDGGIRENVWRDHVQNLQGSFEKAELMKAFWIKFGSAMIGGLFLIVPMLIMTLHKSLATSLITVSVSVILFALFFVFGSEVIGTDLSQQELILSTAAYAAVLVVFVGTGN